MTPPPAHPTPAEQPVLALIQQIKNKQCDPRLLSPEDRRRCVEVLRGEGFNIAEVAQVLNCSERTIRRDLEHLRAAHALTPDPRMAERFIGQLVQEAEISVSRLRRIARESNASAMERLMAETAAWKVFRELFQSMQSVGYLPRVPTNVVAEVFQRFDVEPVAAYDDLRQQMQEVMEVSQQTGQLNENQAQTYLTLLDELERGRLAVRVEKLKTDMKSP